MKYFPILLLLITQVCFGQEKQRIYKFDYLIEYEYQENTEAVTEKRYILTNSQQSNYKITVKAKDSIYELQFIDQDGVYGHFSLAKADFYQAMTFDLNCDIVTRYRNPYIYKRKEYEFTTIKDTVINSHSFQQYILKYTGKKKKVPHDQHRIVYLLEKNTSYHLPIFTHPIAYEEWKKEKTLPNGIPRLMYCVQKDQEKFHSYNLKNIYKIEKFISFNKDCKRLKGSSLPPILDF